MKKRIKFISILLILALLCCGAKASESMPYDILVEDETWYLVMKGKYAQDPSDYGSWELFEECVEFKSMAEMKNDLETGNFTEEELEMISGYITDSKGRLPICDLTALIEPTYPSDFVYQTITWTGRSYTFSLDVNESIVRGDLYADFQFKNQRDWKYSVDFYSNYEEQEDSILKVTTEPERNAKVYYFTMFGDRGKKNVYYTIETGSKQLYIWEEYDEMYSINRDPSVPWKILIYGKQDETYFYVSMRDFKERPTVEWLSEFGVKHYVDTAENTDTPKAQWWKYGLYVGVPLVGTVTAFTVVSIIRHRRKKKISESNSAE